MTVSVERSNGQCIMEIEGEMTIFNASELKTVLLDHLSSLDACEELLLDLSRIGEMDSSGFQLLLLLKREAGRMNKPLRIKEQSAAVSSVLEIYRMFDYFKQ